MAVRVREYKEHVKVFLPQSTFMHIDMATVQDNHNDIRLGGCDHA